MTPKVYERILSAVEQIGQDTVFSEMIDWLGDANGEEFLDNLETNHDITTKAPPTRFRNK